MWEIVGISKELAKLGALWLFWLQTAKRMKEGCAENAVFHFPRDGKTTSEEVGPVEVLKFLRLTFFVPNLVQSLLFLSSSLLPSLLTECFMGLPLFPSGSWGCNFRLFPQYIQYVSSQWISVKEISCSYRMLLDNINTWKLLCKIRFRLPGLRVVSCKFFFPQVLNFLVCSRWMVSIDFRQRYFYWAYIMQELCLKKVNIFYFAWLWMSQTPLV